ncbi:hypothetical protein HYH02_011507 [Chlamydomonas schloesseri]|uniref:UBC core domain-containing protein n=1 Tax=Chlamydomonas schloesseri TaxID=2026947 RepID=A0A835W285_9CHLO|nr:hypothetical protein HYH02_011507 [Chlamydomonas schloesseri]|eukprot:KAG2436570.1 hypothetical protein HYH02_011507 [Chlamydomonas schloesseri]
MTRDIKEMMQAPPAGISAWATGNTISRCDAQIIGPDGTPYAGGIFQLRITFPDRYPMEPPNVKFVTKVYHPNVSKEDGNICCSVLNMPPKGDWKPAHSLRTVLLSIQSLLAEPNPADPLDADAARELTSHPQLFHSRAAEWTRLYATPDMPRGAPGNAPASTSAPGTAAAAATAVKAQAGGSTVARAQQPLTEVQPQAPGQGQGPQAGRGGAPSTAAPAPDQEQQCAVTAPVADSRTPSSTVHDAADGARGAFTSSAVCQDAGPDAGEGRLSAGGAVIDAGSVPPDVTGVAGPEQRAGKELPAGSSAAAGAVEAKRPPEHSSKLSKLSKRPRA